MKIKKSTRYILATLLIIIMVVIIGSLVLRYHIQPNKVYYLDQNNLIEDNSFESITQIIGDCCDGARGNASISLSESTDAFDGKYSLNLTSKNHCACINKPIVKIYNNQNYLFSFYYKGDSPRFCIWVTKDNKCLQERSFEETNTWKK